MDTDAVIFAISSPQGMSLRGLIRGSGKGVFDIINTLTVKSDNYSQSLHNRGMHFVRLKLGEQSLPAILLSMPGPGSYTGEDIAEILLPGNAYLLNLLIDSFIDKGDELDIYARRATAGEFTARAFFNEKISLTEAEGIAATISAKSDAELRAAHLLTSGTLGRLATQLADDLASALALVEAGIDFTDQEDVVAIEPADLSNRLNTLLKQIKQQLEKAVGFEELQAIPWVVLAGPPNSGKSTLFNALLGKDRAVVSSIAGTTRDILAEPLLLDNKINAGEIMLVDIAGLDKADDTFINQAMQQAAQEAIDRAELVIKCNASDSKVLEKHETVKIKNATPVLNVKTKSDLCDNNSTSNDEICVSATNNVGLDALRIEIAKRLANRAVSLADDALALQPRHENALRNALSQIEEAASLIESESDIQRLIHPEVLAAVMRLALDQLGELAGEITPDDVLGRVFSSFCVGK